VSRRPPGVATIIVNGSSAASDSAPLRDQLTIAGKPDCLRKTRRDVHRDLPTTVVIERLGNELSRYRVGTCRFRRCLGTACANGRLVIDGRTSGNGEERCGDLRAPAVSPPRR
jgi:hypothetical protein